MRSPDNGAKMRLPPIGYVCIIAHMTVSERIAAVEERAKERGLSVADLCVAAHVHRATWQRWKAGRGEPGVTQWDAVEALIERKAA